MTVALQMLQRCISLEGGVMNLAAPHPSRFSRRSPRLGMKELRILEVSFGRHWLIDDMPFASTTFDKSSVWLSAAVASMFPARRLDHLCVLEAVCLSIRKLWMEGSDKSCERVCSQRGALWNYCKGLPPIKTQGRTHNCLWSSWQRSRGRL